MQVGQRRRAHQQLSQRTRCACIEAEAGPDQLQGQDREDWNATVRLIEELVGTLSFCTSSLIPGFLTL